MLESLNQLPKQQHGTDIMRVRLHLLASQGQLYRQTIMTSSFPAPQLNAAFNQLCTSHAGKFKLVSQPTGVLAQVVPQVGTGGLLHTCLITSIHQPISLRCIQQPK